MKLFKAIKKLFKKEEEIKIEKKVFIDCNKLFLFNKENNNGKI